MAACLISVTGTDGLLRLDYKIGAIPYSLETSKGSFYIEDTATDVTYTTLTGDVIASSLCLTITELPATCSVIGWQNINLQNLVIDAVILGTTTYTFSDISLINAGITLADTINSLNINDIKVIGYLPYNENISSPSGTIVTNIGWSYLFKTTGSDLPSIRIRETISDLYLYINGIEQFCSIIEGYQSVNPCYSLTTTTTTSV